MFKLNKITNFLDTHPIGRVFKLGQNKAVWPAGRSFSVVWKKVSELTAGAKIAVEENGHLEWDEIAEIKSVGRERVYDIEVEGTHNFVGNGILAHNTYISNYLLTGANSATHTMGAGDILASSDIEVDGTFYLDGGQIANSAGTAAVLLSSAPTTTASTLSAGNWLIENTANLGQATLIVNQTKAGDLFTASASGTPKFVITNGGNVGIGTTAPSYKLDVTGDINFTGALREDGVEIFSGMITPFVGACPTGWTEYTAARGRYIVGTPSGGTNAATVGTALTDQENRATGQHNHGITDPGHTHPYTGMEIQSPEDCGYLGSYRPVAVSMVTQSSTTGITINNAGSVAGTNAPYIQLTYCQKTAGSDLAEWIQSNDQIEKTSIVSVDPNNTEKVVASTQEYDSKVIGIIATIPGWLIGTESQDGVQMALAGRVPTKVTLKNGEIKHGDPITTSTITGVGMKATKAGSIIGKAMEAFNETSSTSDCQDPATGRAEKCGTILVFVNVSWFDPDVYLTDSGDLKIAKVNSSSISNDSTSEESVPATSEVLELRNGAGEIIDRIGAFAEVVAANIRAGAITTRQLAADSLTAFTATIDNLLINNSLVSPIVETNLISPLADSDTVTIQTKNLVVENASGSAAVKIIGDLTVENASISGQLYAESIVSPELDEIQELLRKVEVDQNLLAQVASWNTNTASESAMADGQWLMVNTEELFVTGQAAISSLSVSNSLSLGTDLVIQTSSINTLTAPLALQSLAMAPVEIMAGKFRIETNGDVTINANLYVAGKIESESIKTKEITTERLVIATSPTSEESVPTSEVSTTSAVIKSNAIAGSAVIPAGISEIAINNPNISDYTLIYVTPTSSTENNVLFVKSKDKGTFTVGFNTPIDIDVSFNWWVIDVTQ